MSRYDHPQIKFIKNINPDIPNIDQFNMIRSYDWGDEKIQVDIFCEVLKKIKNKRPSIIEFGSAGIGGSFYSILFEKWFDENCIIVNNDPRYDILYEIKTYWKDQHLKNAILYHGYVGIPKHYQAKPDFIKEETPIVYISDVLNDCKISTLDILHADIQGSEVSLLEEIVADNLINRIKYYFISTHQGEDIDTYYKCVEIFEKNMNCNFHFSDPKKGGWGDGLIVVENVNCEDV
jgi:hypothetical protein